VEFKNLLLGAFFVFLTAFSPQKKQETEVFWCVNLEKIDISDFYSKIEQFPPDSVILTVFSCDDYYAFNDTRIDVYEIFDFLKQRKIKVYFGFSLFSRPVYALNNLQAKAVRKPVPGFYVPPGMDTTLNPLYEPLIDNLIEIINDSISKIKPDGLSFDHTRFFTFDEDFSNLSRKYYMEKYNFDLNNFTPKPIFILNQKEVGWTREDKLFYDVKAEIIHTGTRKIRDNFSDFEVLAPTMGMTEPARSAGQYVELQREIFDKFLLMAYDKNSTEAVRNLNETMKASKKPVILGIHPFFSDAEAIENIDNAVKNRAFGVYLLGFNFSDAVFRHLSLIRGNI